MLTFGPGHYVPVLKVKPAEKSALRRLDPAIAAHVTPLVEIVERKPKPAKKKGDPDVLPSVDDHLKTSFKGFGTAVEGFQRYLLDCREIASDGHAAAAAAFARAHAIGVPFVPVTSLLRTSDVAAALSHRAHGVALRLSVDEFESGLIPTRLPKFLQDHSIKPSEVDLLVDLGAVDQMIDVGVQALAAGFLAAVPMPSAWRTLTLTGCAFPSSMGAVNANAQATVNRLEWLYWRDALHANRAALTRLPTFSDCAIQHRDGVEGFDPRKMSASAAIRFTDGDSWLLVKGESMKLKGGKQFQALSAKLLGSANTTVAADHCAGCAGVHTAAACVTGFGSLLKWRELGTIHHITQTVESLAALQWP
ncbi:MAG: beta family protein [Myxococcales bacterium]|nr:beta family protein [Myxococcales bacterium]